MHRFYIQPQNINKGHVQLSAQEAKHAFSVLRFKPNDEINIFDGKGNVYRGLIKSLTKNRGLILIKDKQTVPAPAHNIALACAIPKNCKFEDIIDTATQIGVQTIIPMLTARTIVKIHQEKQKPKQDRWQKIAIKSAKQSQIEYIPEINPVIDFCAVLNKAADFDIALIPSLQKGNLPLKKVLRDENNEHSNRKSIIVLIGPEGDFTDAEIALAKTKGFYGVSLGGNVLRCQTAVSKILSIINYEWKE